MLTGSATARRKKRRDARVAEGAPLLREYRVKSLIEGSNPSLSANNAKSSWIHGLFLWEIFFAALRSMDK